MALAVRSRAPATALALRRQYLPYRSADRHKFLDLRGDRNVRCRAWRVVGDEQRDGRPVPSAGIATSLAISVRYS